MVAAGPASLVQLGDGLREQVEGRVVVERAGHEAQPFGEGAPDLFTKRGAGSFPNRLVDDLAEVLIGPVPVLCPAKSVFVVRSVFNIVILSKMIAVLSRYQCDSGHVQI